MSLCPDCQISLSIDEHGQYCEQCLFMPDLEFDYEKETIDNISVTSLLKWIETLHSEMAEDAWRLISTQTHNELMLLAKVSEGNDS